MFSCGGVTRCPNSHVCNIVYMLCADIAWYSLPFTIACLDPFFCVPVVYASPVTMQDWLFCNYDYVCLTFCVPISPVRRYNLAGCLNTMPNHSCWIACYLTPFLLRIPYFVLPLTYHSLFADDRRGVGTGCEASTRILCCGIPTVDNHGCAVD